MKLRQWENLLAESRHLIALEDHPPPPPPPPKVINFYVRRMSTYRSCGRPCKEVHSAKTTTTATTARVRNCFSLKRQHGLQWKVLKELAHMASKEEKWKLLLNKIARHLTSTDINSIIFLQDIPGKHLVKSEDLVKNSSMRMI